MRFSRIVFGGVSDSPVDYRQLKGPIISVLLARIIAKVASLGGANWPQFSEGVT